MQSNVQRRCSAHLLKSGNIEAFESKFEIAANNKPNDENALSKILLINVKSIRKCVL